MQNKQYNYTESALDSVVKMKNNSQKNMTMCNSKIILEPIFKLNSNNQTEVTGFIKRDDLVPKDLEKRYASKLDIVNELYNYVTKNDNKGIKQLEDRINLTIKDIADYISKLENIKKDYSLVSEKIKTTVIETTKELRFNYTNVQILENIKYQTEENEKNGQTNFTYVVQMNSVPEKFKKNINNNYSQLLLPVQIQRKNIIIIIRYQHNESISEGQIIGTRC